MKRKELIKYIERFGCVFYREGRKHTVYLNPKNRQTSTIPRHTDVDEYLTIKICKDLGVPRIDSQ
jgi:mRNA interferase HicA